jgi:TonB family protein
LKQVTPKYTADALRQRIQGVVALEVVVSREGIPTAIRVTHSLDAGLDGEAVAAVRNGVSRLAGSAMLLSMCS